MQPLLQQKGIVDSGDLVILSQDDSTHSRGGTNTMKILAVP